MSKFGVKKGLKSNINSASYSDGQVYFVYDNDDLSIYADIDNTRRKLESPVSDINTLYSNVSELRNDLNSTESAYALAEQSRILAEQARVSAETSRSNAETSRVNAETIRATEWTSIKNDAVSATSAANTAASSANTAASDIRAAATRGDFDGYSPTVSISSTDSAHTVTITDKAGDHSYTVPTYAEEEAARAYAWGELSAEATEAIEDAQEAATEVKPQVAQLTESVVKQFNTLEPYLYKRDTYIANGNVDTALAGYDTYKIPVKQNDLVVMHWSDAFYYQLNKSYALTVELADGTIVRNTIDSSNVNWYRFSSTVKQGIARMPENAKYFAITVYRERFDTLTSVMVNTPNIVLNDGTVVRKLQTLTEIDDSCAAKNRFYFSNSSSGIGILSDQYYALLMPISEGDKVRFSGRDAAFAYYGTFTGFTTGTTANITTDEYTAPEDGILCEFPTFDGIPNATIVAADSVRIGTSNIVIDSPNSVAVPKNLFEMHSPDTTFGYSYDGTGTLVATGQYGSSQLIPVKGGHKYTAQHKGVVVWYDSNGDYLTSTAASAHASQGYVIPPANASFARFTYQTATVDSFWVHSDDTADITTPKVPVTLADTTFSEPKNLFDKDADNDLTGYYNTSGVHQSSSTLGQTDYVPVVQGYFYTTPVQNVFVLWYDLNKELIGNTSSQHFSVWGKVRPIPDAAYAKFIFQIADIATFYIHSDRPEDQQVDSAYLPDASVGTLPFDGISWASFGDSITARNTWQPYVINSLGMAHTNCGIGSTPLSGSNANAFWQTVRLDAVKAANPDIVTILGGANDLVLNPVIGTDANLADKDTSTFIGAYSYIIDNLLTWKPSLRVFILSTTWAHNDGASYSQTVTYGQFAAACKKVAEYYKLPFVDLYNNSGFNAYTMGSSPNDVYSADHIHPNDKGARIIASQVIAKMLEVMQVH